MFTRRNKKKKIIYLIKDIHFKNYMANFSAIHGISLDDSRYLIQENKIWYIKMLFHKYINILHMHLINLRKDNRVMNGK